MNIKTLTATEAAAALRNKEFSAVELAATYIKKSEEENPALNVYVEIFEDCVAQAKYADTLLSRGEGGPLTGIPIAVKDNILIEGRTVSAASRMLERYIASYDATVITKLKAEGTVFVGRTNMDEFAMGSSTEHSAFGVTKNPHDHERVAGGSSGGSAAAVASGSALLALGSDTGGSIREPAAFCGVVGLKPTYGAVSRYGLIAMGSSLDQIGPFAKTPEDAKLLFDAIRGHDPKDSTSRSETSSVSHTNKKVVGVPRHFFTEGVDAEVLQVFERALSELSKDGYAITEIELPYLKYALACYYIVMPAEASTNLARFDGIRYGLHVDGSDLLDEYRQTRAAGFGTEVRRRILLGTYVLSAGYYDAYYEKANEVRRLISRDFDTAFQSVDVIATPTTPTPAFKIGEKKDPVSMYLEDIFAVPANLAGIPAISIPIGTVARGTSKLPVGLQFMGPHFSEDLLCSIGASVMKT